MTTTIDLSGSGAVLTGTTREDAPTLKPHGWRWSRNLGAWFLPRTLRPETVTYKVCCTVRDLGRAVDIIGGDERDDDAARADRRHERDRELVGVHEARAERLDAIATGHFDRAHDATAGIPFGQPILLGHHSQRRHERALERSHAAMGKGVEAHRDAEGERSRAQSAAHRVARTEARQAGPQFGPDDVEVGDIIQTPWSDALVLRVSKKSVTVPSFVCGLPYTDTLDYRKVRGISHKATDRTREAVTEALAEVKAHRAKGGAR